LRETRKSWENAHIFKTPKLFSGKLSGTFRDIFWIFVFTIMMNMILICLQTFESGHLKRVAIFDGIYFPFDIPTDSEH
jgi:hypothetical protein